MPYEIVLKNNSPHPITIDFLKGKKTVIASGQTAEFKFDYDFTQAVLVIGGVKYGVSWHYPPKEMMDDSKSSRKFALSFEPDERIYALKMWPAGADGRPLQPQPEGFPLSPEIKEAGK